MPIKSEPNPSFHKGFLEFLQQSPSPFHAVGSMAEALKTAGFKELTESSAWKLKPGARHFICKNGSLVAFELGERPIEETGFRMVAAHSDSPGLRLKPAPETNSGGAWKLGVEVYGSPILSTWFDRDLSLAGRVLVKDKQGAIQSVLVNLRRPIAVVPNLAIHLNRTVNKERSINEQTELPAVWSLSEAGKDLRGFLSEQVSEQGHRVSVVEHELCLYDVQPPEMLGMHGEFLANARLDNLASCYVGLQAFLNSSTTCGKVFAAFDHEEVGSRSLTGAHGSFLLSVVDRICGSAEIRWRALSQSVLVSADNAHAMHPNYIDKMDPQHAPRLNAGPVLKANANQSYATNARTAAWFGACCEEAKIPVQRFVVRTDMACGSTVGPIVSSQLGVETVDVGMPQWAMHSCRETMGTQDLLHLHRVLSVFYSATF